MKNYRAIIFDLDDTLYPERDYVRSGFRAVAKCCESHFGISANTIVYELQKMFDDGLRFNIFNKWLMDHGLDPEEFVPRMVAVYREHLPQIKPFEGVTELLSALKQNFQLALLSDGYLSSQGKKMQVLNLSSFFDAVVFSDEWGKEAWKPNPWIFKFTLERLQVDPSAAIYVGDNPGKDFVGAKGLNLRTIRMRIPTGLYSQDDPPAENYAPDDEVTSYSQLALLLLG